MTRGTFRFAGVLVHVMMRQFADRVRASAVIEVEATETRPSRAIPEKFDAPSAKEAWAALSAWVGSTLEEVAP